MPWWVALFFLIAVLLFVAALRWGGWPERTAASANLVGAILTRFAQPAGARFDEIIWPIALIDLGVLAVFGFVALRSDRRWPMVVIALLLPSICAHLFPYLSANNYALAGSVAYLIPPVIALGILRQRRRSRA